MPSSQPGSDCTASSSCCAAARNITFWYDSKHNPIGKSPVSRGDRVSFSVYSKLTPPLSLSERFQNRSTCAYRHRTVCCPKLRNGTEKTLPYARTDCLPHPPIRPAP